MEQQNNHSNKSNLMKYAGLATTWLLTLLVAVFLGYKLDGWLKWGFPLFIILLPVIAIIYLLWQIIKDFSKPK
jgi:F0F1-type ATP synthase assembly protein I